MSSPRFEIRALGDWGREETRDRRSSGSFRATWDDTIKLLLTEVEHLDGTLVVLQVDADPTEIRRDGMLRARTRVDFPGVKVSFESKHGPLTYATDAYEQRWPGDLPGWQANVRAIALGLTALRAVATTQRRRYTPPRPRAEIKPATASQIDREFADNLYELRRDLGITRTELASRTRIAARTIERIERGHSNSGRRPVSIGEAFVIAAALGVHPADLLKEPAP